MTKPVWQLQDSISAVIFDCDGTLSAIEGIDELAKNNNVADTVKSLTEEAMGKSGINPDLYQQRLDLVQPTEEQVHNLGDQYYHHLVPDANPTIQILKRLHKAIYIVSAGLYPAVSGLGLLLEVPRDNIFAVDVTFDKQGNYSDFDRQSPLIHNDGKREIVARLKSLHSSMIYVGDGLNDCAVSGLVTRFIGYGGVFYRENVAAFCDYYIKSPTMSALLPLVLTQREYETLLPHEQVLYHAGLKVL